MTANPLGGLVPYLATRAAGAAPPVWAMVHQTSPLQVRFEGTDTPVDATPLSLVPAHELAPGRRVLTVFVGTVLVVLGVTRGGARDTGTVTSWQDPTLLNGWQNYSTFGSLQVRREGDLVRFRGTVRSGTPGPDSPICVLPPDCHPNRVCLLSGAYGSTQVDVRVNTSGDLYVNDPSVTIGWLSFESVIYAL